MKKVLVASRNPVKINATLNGLKAMFANEEFEIDGVDINSGVRDQPMTDEETLLGATTRVKNLEKLKLKADFYVGIEGGLMETKFGMEAFAWVVIISGEKMGRARSSTFLLPEKIANLIKEGIELGNADDMVFGEKNSKQKYGTVGKLTGNIIDRTKYYTDPVILALIPFKNKDLY